MIIIIIRILYLCIIVSTINTLLFFWPVTFFLGWSLISYKFFIFTSNRVIDLLKNYTIINKQQKFWKNKKLRFNSEEEKKLFYLTRFNTLINKKINEYSDKHADLSKKLIFAYMFYCLFSILNTNFLKK